MMKLSSNDRRVALCSGVPLAEAAAALRLSVDVVRASRRRLGRSVELGLPAGAPQPVAHATAEPEYFDALMRGNRSVCG